MSISFLNDSGVINTIRNISTIQRSLLMARKKTSNSGLVEQSRDENNYPVISEKMREQIGTLAQQLTELEKNITKSNLAVQKISKLEDRLIDLREITEGATTSMESDRETLKKYQKCTSEIAASFNEILQNCQFASENLFDGSEKAISKVNTLELPEIKSPQDAVEILRRIDSSFLRLNTIQTEIRDNIQNYNLSFQSNLEHIFDDLVTDQTAIASSQNARESIKNINLLAQYQQCDPGQTHSFIRAEEVFGLLSP